MSTYKLDIFKFIPLESRLDSKKFLRVYKQISRGARGTPPCDKCQAGCCKCFKVLLHPNEVGRYDHVIDKSNGKPVLPRHADGSCIHLVDNRCGIYTHRPRTCKEFDCRLFDALNIGMPFIDKPKCINTSKNLKEVAILTAMVESLEGSIMLDMDVIVEINKRIAEGADEMDIRDCMFSTIVMTLLKDYGLLRQKIMTLLEANPEIYDELLEHVGALKDFKN